MIQDDLIRNYITEQTASWIEEDISVMQQEFLANKNQIIESLSAIRDEGTVVVSWISVA